jgi:formiminotetrahydrofolate cyclodeaminase
MSSDLTTATALAGAAIQGALANVEINISSLKAETADDEAFVSGVRERVHAIAPGKPA